MSFISPLTTDGEMTVPETYPVDPGGFTRVAVPAAFLGMALPVVVVCGCASQRVYQRLRACVPDEILNAG